MAILCVNVPAFAITVERAQNLALRGLPVVVVAQDAPQAQVLSVSSEAHALGIRKGFKLADVRRLDRRIHILPTNLQLYRRAQDALATLAERFTPIYQPKRPGTFFLDMKGTERLFGKTAIAADRIQNEIAHRLGLVSTVGAAENKLVSRIATKVVRPRGLCSVFAGNEAAFLAPLALELLPVVREFPQPELFRELGLRHIGDVASVPGWLLGEIFGHKAEILKRQALGRDSEPVTLPHAEATLSHELILSPETNSDTRLLGLLWQAVETLARGLRGLRGVAGEIRLEAVFADRDAIRASWPVTPPTQRDVELFGVIQSRWPCFIKRRVALKSLMLSLARIGPEFHQPMLAGLSAECARSGLKNDARGHNLALALDRLRRKYGDAIIRISRF